MLTKRYTAAWGDFAMRAIGLVFLLFGTAQGALAQRADVSIGTERAGSIFGGLDELGSLRLLGQPNGDAAMDIGGGTTAPGTDRPLPSPSPTFTPNPADKIACLAKGGRWLPATGGCVSR